MGKKPKGCFNFAKKKEGKIFFQAIKRHVLFFIAQNNKNKKYNKKNNHPQYLAQFCIFFCIAVVIINQDCVSMCVCESRMEVLDNTQITKMFWFFFKSLFCK